MTLVEAAIVFVDLFQAHPDAEGSTTLSVMLR
jgi:hypothetical protein